MRGGWSTDIDRKALLFGVNRDVRGCFTGPHPPRLAGRFRGISHESAILRTLFLFPSHDSRQDGATT
jgi:hypothetical protein